MLAMALQADGWYLRSDIIWSKPNPMPESVTDRPTKAHEYLFLLTRRSIGIELNAEYAQLAATRLQQLSLLAEPYERRPAPQERPRGLTGGAHNPPGQSPHSNAR